MRFRVRGAALIAFAASPMLGACRQHETPAAPPSAQDPCPRSAALKVGPGEGALYRSVAPFEHHDAQRTHRFNATCTVAELAGDGVEPEIAQRVAPDDYSMPYILQTRERNQLYVYGFTPETATQGGFVARVDADSLKQLWRTWLPDPKPAAQWSWPGVVTVHGNGALYAVFGNRFYKLDAESGEILARQSLPEGEYGAVYNGMDVLSDGRLVTKNMELGGECSTLQLREKLAERSSRLLQAAMPLQTFGGLLCHLKNNHLPSTLVVLDPDELEVVAQIELPEPITGRVSTERHDGTEYVYVPGSKNLFRYVYDGDKLEPDSSWGPVPYVEDGQGPAAAASFLDGFAILHVNGYTRASSLVAIDLRDASRSHRIEPFEWGDDIDIGPSFVLSMPSIDPENHLIVAIDTLAWRMGGVRFDADKGFSMAWTRAAVSVAFSALTGPPESREIVVPDMLSLGPLSGDPIGTAASDRVLWLDAQTGAEIVASPALTHRPAPGNIVTPGFGGRFYYLGADGKLRELSVRAAVED